MRRILPLVALLAFACADGDPRAALDADELAHDTLPLTGAADTARDTAVAPVGDCAVPVSEPAEGERVVQVWFTCRGSHRPVARIVQDTPAVLLFAMRELVRGPTEAEQAAGFHSFFSEETAGSVRSVVVDDGVARIDFDDFSAVIPNASSSAGSADLLAQLRQTIFQYPTIREAQITFEGSCDAFWNWLQRGCQPLVPPASR